jgi:hypothetical protein
MGPHGFLQGELPSFYWTLEAHFCRKCGKFPVLSEKLTVAYVIFRVALFIFFFRCELLNRSAVLCILIGLKVPSTQRNIQLISYVRLIYFSTYIAIDCLCDLVVRVPGYRSRGPGFDSRRYRISWEAVGLERGPLSIEELLEWKSSGSGLENRD